MFTPLIYTMSPKIVEFFFRFVSLTACEGHSKMKLSKRISIADWLAFIDIAVSLFYLNHLFLGATLAS